MEQRHSRTGHWQGAEATNRSNGRTMTMYQDCMLPPSVRGQSTPAWYWPSMA